MPAVIFTGDTVKALKSALKLGDNSTITSGSADPTSVATAGTSGDVYISTSTKLIYVKQDSGTTTNWNSPIFSDGSNFAYNTGTHTLTVANLTVNGTTTNINTTNVNVSDKLVILNKGGIATSGSNVGFEVEENNAITGYIQTSTDRDSWAFKAPNTAGEAIITPGAGGVNISGTTTGSAVNGTLQVDNITPTDVAFIIKGAPSDAPLDLLFDATYTNMGSLDATYVQQGSATPVGTVGSPVVTSNQLDLTANTGQFIEYDGLSSSLAIQTGTIRFKYNPNYTGTPATDAMRLFALGDGSDTNQILIYHESGDGFLVFRVFGSNSGQIFELDTPYSPVSGVTDEFEFSWDLDTGANRVFINGIQQGATNTSTGSRSSSNITGIWIGANNGGSFPGSNFLVTDIVVFNTIQHNSNFTSPIDPILGPFLAPQTADLQEWKSSMDVTLSFVDSAGFITLPGDPTTSLMAATKQYVDSHPLVITSDPSAGGGTSESLTITGILSSDTILSVTQQTAGANNTAITGYNSLGDDTLTITWTGDPGAGAIVIVSVRR